MKRERFTNMVTGVGGFSGRYIAEKLLESGERVSTLTGHPRENPFGERVKAFPYNFDSPASLEKCLRGVDVLYNSYWIRFPRGRLTYDLAIRNTRTLIEAARRAGVHKIAHISITNPSLESPYRYFSGKAEVEKIIEDSGLAYAIVRPAVIFGPEDILINNIAWMLRKLPVFGVIGSGKYRVRPIFVEDLADLIVDLAHEDKNTIVDAVGPETFTFNEMVRVIRRTIGAHSLIFHVPVWAGYLFSKLIGLVVGDVVLTKEEILGLKANLLVTHGPPTGQTRLSEYLEQNKKKVGVRYASELKRHYRQK